MRPLLASAALAGMLVLALPAAGHATQIFGDQTGKQCGYCHIGKPDELKFTPNGELFIKNYYQLPGTERRGEKEGLAAGIQGNVRRLLLAFHAVSAMSLVGVLVYIGLASPHTPAETGVPIKDRKFIWLNLIGAAASGAALCTFVVMPEKAFWESTFGGYLALKIILFALLAGLLGFNAVIAGKIGRLRGRIAELSAKPDFTKFEKISPSDLRRFNGMKGRPALVAHKGSVYDVTRSPKWQGGLHFNKHTAGADLTAVFPQAPHGEKVLDAVKKVGTFDGGAAGSGHPEIRLFEGLAGRHLSISRYAAAFAVGLAAVVALWRH